MNRKNTMVNITYRNNPKEVDWTWAWGADVGRIGKKRMKQGFKRVSYDSFRRKSGLKIGCAIWHKQTYGTLSLGPQAPKGILPCVSAQLSGGEGSGMALWASVRCQFCLVLKSAFLFNPTLWAF